MANPSTATSNAASAVVDEAVRIAAQGSRRTTESTQAAVQAARGYFDLFTAGADAGFQTAFEFQNAGIAGAQALFDSYVGISRTAFGRYAELTRQAQESAVKTFQLGTRVIAATLTTD
jgi:hypothetical protein